MSDLKPKILFLFVHNAVRSQMAAGFARQLGTAELIVDSAGSASGVPNPSAVGSMNAKGIDISHESPTVLTGEMGERMVIVTMGCGDTCLACIAKRDLDWDFEDPAGINVEAMRSIRDEIEKRARESIADLISHRWQTTNALLRALPKSTENRTGQGEFRYSQNLPNTTLKITR